MNIEAFERGGEIEGAVADRLSTSERSAPAGLARRHDGSTCKRVPTQVPQSSSGWGGRRRHTEVIIWKIKSVGAGDPITQRQYSGVCIVLMDFYISSLW